LGEKKLSVTKYKLTEEIRKINPIFTTPEDLKNPEKGLRQIPEKGLTPITHGDILFTRDSSVGLKIKTAWPSTV
jgi:isopentenyl phosphate kinase